MRYLRTKSGVGLVVMLVLMASVALLRADPGDLDLTFGGGDGYVTTDVYTQDIAFSTVVDSLGRIIVVGESNDNPESNIRQCLIARYMADGSLDTTFGNSGIAKLDFSPNVCSLAKVVLDADERIVVAGGFLARFNSDGSLDTTFGDEGLVRVPIARFLALYIASDGKITAIAADLDTIFLARYYADGSLDTSFGDNGSTVGLSGTPAWSLLPTSDGGTVFTGYQRSEENISQNDIFVAKYTAAGILDPNFGDSGIVITDIDELDWAHQAILDNQGRILVVGSSGFIHTNEMDLSNLVLRYLPDGTLDATFGDNGIVLTEIYDTTEGSAVAIDEANRILTAGMYVDTSNPFPVYSGFVARYTADGALDITFGDDNGLSPFVLPVEVQFLDMKLDKTGRVVLVGIISNYPEYDFLVARFQGGDLPATATPTATDTTTSTETLEPTTTFTPTNTLTPTLTTTDSPTQTATIEATVEPTATTTPDTGIDLVVNGGFETELNGWQSKNLTSDKVKCDKPGKPVAYEGSCAFRFKGSVGENSQLFQKPNLGGQTFKAGDVFILQAYIHARGQVDFQAQAKFTYADDVKEKIVINLSAATEGYTVFADDYALMDANLVKVKVTLKNKSTSGKLDVDAVSLSYVAAESGLLPLP